MILFWAYHRRYNLKFFQSTVKLKQPLNLALGRLLYTCKFCITLILLKQIVQSHVDMVEIFPEHVTVKFKVDFDLDVSQPNKIEYRFEKAADRAELKAS